MNRRGRCKRRRKSMAGGKGTAEIKKSDNDCRSPNFKEDIAEKPLGSPEITEPPSSRVPVDLYTQARKTLSFRSPYDSDGSSSAQAFVSTANNLPSGVSNLLTLHSESRKRHKKLHSKSEKKSSASTKVRVNSIWEETEEYFRELTVEDVDRLERLSDVGVSCDQSLLLTPCLDEDGKFFDRQETISRMLANDCMKDINELMMLQNGHHSLDGNAGERSEMDIRPNKNGVDCPNDQGPSNSFSGVEWLLGCRSKTFFSSDRPSKKRKLSCRDAGLEKLYTARPVEGEESLCHYCSYGDKGDPLNCLIKCSSCGMVVHQRCYGVQGDVDRCWLCSWCQLRNASEVNAEAQCVLCPKQGGALKPVNLGGVRRENDDSKVEFVHLFCCLWAHETYVENIDSMESVMNVSESRDTRKRLVCSLCKIKCGTCVRCSTGSCRNSFHPICAREARHRLEIWRKHGSDEVELHAFCLKHSEVHCDDNCPETGDSSLTSDCVSNGYGEHSKETERNLESERENGDVLDPVAVNCPANRPDTKESNACIINFNMILQKLIDVGKVNADIVAKEIGVPPQSLTKILTDKDIDPAMQTKVVRWLINNAHFGNFQKILKQKIQSLLAVKENPCAADGVSTRSVANSRNSLAVPVKSVAPHRRNNASLKSVKDDSTCASKGSIDEFSDQGDIEKMFIDPGHNDNTANDSNGNEVKLKALAQCFSEDAKLMQLMTSPSVLKTGDMSCASYMHPTIYGKLMEAKSGTLQETDRCLSAVLRNREASQTSSSFGNCCTNPSLLASSTDGSSECDGLNVDQLKSLRNSGMLGLAPVDEVEGELMYYQQRLIYMTVLGKHLTDDLMAKVVRILPGEIANAGEQKWDAVLVNQYNHNQREAKKQGRKERRHKEAQAVLAAATAAAAASSRLSSNRKDNLEESSPPEDLLKMRLLDSRSLRQTVMRSSENSDPDLFDSSPNKNYTRICDVCHRKETMLNPVLLCSGCKVSVHLDCYRSDKNTVGPWYCELCEESISSRGLGALASDSSAKRNLVPECALCGGTAGAFRKSGDGRWMHALCAEWILDSTYRRGQPNPIEGIDSVARGTEVCTVCSRNQGACIKCCYGHCHTSFHPTCARSAGFYMTVRAIGGGKLQHKAYCEKHSIEQRAKAGIQKHGSEELKRLKQIRVELEKLRLLCERIVKREKLKRELVLCSHDVLASTQDSVLSALAHHPFYQPEVSSESATTSLKAHMDDYRSCTGMVQRADDITVDCTVAGKRRVRLPVSFDSSDQKTDDSSASPGKPRNRASFSDDEKNRKYSEKIHGV